MGSVRAKFRVTEKSERWAVPRPESGEDCTVEVKLQPVYEHETIQRDGIQIGRNMVEENRMFGEATPAGQIAMLLKTRAAADEFAVGRAYYVEFIPAQG